MSTGRSRVGHEIEAALGEVLAHIRGEVELPCRVIDDPRKGRSKGEEKEMIWSGVLKTVVVALVLVYATQAGAEYEAGQHAWDAGQRDAAIAEWRAGADAGEAKSMLALGRLYLQGVGVPQNYVQAHMWFNLAASRGEAEAIAERDALAAKMTPDAIAEAQKLTLSWQPARRQLRPNALHRAVQDGSLSGLQAALAAGVDVNIRDARGWTVLMHAANQGYTLLVPPLLEANADLNVRAADGATALFIAALHGYTEIVVALLKAGADTSFRGPKGRTALGVAQVQGHSKVVALPEFAPLLEAAKEREESEAFSRAKALDIPKAYKDYLAAWCPQGNSCATARAKLGESIKASLTGQTFSGVNSGGGPVFSGTHVSLTFSSSGKYTGIYILPDSDQARCPGTWRVEGGKVRLNCKWFNQSRVILSGVAELEDNILVGREVITDNTLILGAFLGAVFGKTRTMPWTWRLSKH